MGYVKLETTAVTGPNRGTTMINVSMVCGIVQYMELGEVMYDIHMSSGTIFTTKETDKIQELMEMI